MPGALMPRRSRLRPAASARLRCDARTGGLLRSGPGCTIFSSLDRSEPGAPSAFGRPARPALLAASEIARQAPPPPRSARSPLLEEGNIEVRSRRRAVSPFTARGVDRADGRVRTPASNASRASAHHRKLARRPPVPDVHARLRERTSMSLLLQRGDVDRAGRRGFLLRDFGGGEKRRAGGSAEGRRSAWLRSPERRGRVAARTRAEEPAWPSIAAQSVQAAGRSRPPRHERNRNPRRLATRRFAERPRPPALRRLAKRAAPQANQRG